jgi:hypothetical protein
VKSVLAAELAVLVHFKPVRVVFLVLLCVVIALLALCARQCNLDSHFSAPPDEISSLENKGKLSMLPDMPEALASLGRGFIFCKWA